MEPKPPRASARHRRRPKSSRLADISAARRLRGFRSRDRTWREPTRKALRSRRRCLTRLQVGYPRPPVGLRDRCARECRRPRPPALFGQIVIDHLNAQSELTLSRRLRAMSSAINLSNTSLLSSRTKKKSAPWVLVRSKPASILRDANRRGALVW
ncbi:hypothetical protein RM53_09070 [Brevundimonas nasdae]|uniref:Uncharacterized protein n=1 Tax=Brevundimonas nasdae TaxID=172043 RepID=A0A0B4CAB2_9CAUL|nr:hypothetical protein RM53_09070 [Brevundimonas nasdae]